MWVSDASFCDAEQLSSVGSTKVVAPADLDVDPHVRGRVGLKTRVLLWLCLFTP